MIVPHFLAGFLVGAIIGAAIVKNDDRRAGLPVERCKHCGGRQLPEKMGGGWFCGWCGERS